jgi:hypothetical protein
MANTTTKKAKSAAARARAEASKNLVRVHLPTIGDDAESDKVKTDQTVPVGINGEFMIATRGPGARVTPEMFIVMAQSKRFKDL